MKKIIPLLALALSCPPLTAQVDYDGNYPWSQRTNVAPDSAVPGWFYNLGITGMRVKLDPAAPRTLVVKYVFAGTPAALAGVQVNDVITGVEGQPFTADHQDGYGVAVFGARGPISEFGNALDDVQGVDGLLGVTLTRGSSTLSVTLNVGQVYGSFSPTFPLNCPKSDLILSQLLTYLRQTQEVDGAWGDGNHRSHENSIFAGLALLSDGSAASMTAAGKLATYYSNQTNGPIPAAGLGNWKYLAASIYLSEYYHKTNDATVLIKLNTLYSRLFASQYTNVPGASGSNPTIPGFGGWGHNPGFEGYGPIGMTTGQGALAFALMKRVGVDVDRTRLDAAYDFLVKGTGANNYVWYADSIGGSGPYDWGDPGRTGAAAIANWMCPYTEPAYATRAIGYARFMGAHPQTFPDTHGSPTIGMAYAAMGAHFDPESFRRLLDNNRWWFSLAQTPEGNFYYQPNRDNAYYSLIPPRLVASSVTALILSLPKRNLMISERVVSADGGVVTNGNFQMYKPGTGYTVTAVFADAGSYARGVGNGIVLGGGSVNYADGTTGTTVDLPGWTPLQSSNDLSANGVAGSTGMNFFAAWGGDGRIQSASPLGTVQEGGKYTISAMVGGPADGPIQGPLAFHLFANGVQLTPTSSVNPTLPHGGGFQQISRIYEGAALAGHIGASLTIVLGVENANDAGNRVIFDDVAIKGLGVPQASFESAPTAISTTAVSMTATTATTGTTAAGPAQYLFTETSGNPGATSSGWQTSPSYTDSGLTSSTRYTYTVTMRYALATTVNSFVPTAALSATTQIAGFGGLVTNGNFQMYKPGTAYTVTAAFADGGSYAKGLGDGIVLAGGTVNYADGTSGTTVDLPGWTSVQGGNDLSANGVDGSTGMNLFAAWGGDDRIQSASSLGTVHEGGVYTISAMVGGPADGPIQGPLAFHLLADGVQLTPTSSVNPTLPNGGGFQQISRTYQGAALAGHDGASLTIVLGVENANDAGSRVIFDNVAILLDTAQTTGFSNWQSANATAQTLDLDHDNDGVPNGIEFFLGGITSTTGPTTLPGVSKTSGALSITWPKSTTYPGIYGTDYRVETSDTLTGNWIPETLGGNVTISGGDVKYTYPTPLSTKKFARLRVTGP